MIKYTSNETHYYDKNGVEIHEGDTIRWPSGKEEKVYLTEDGYLGTDATNPAWIKAGRAVPCEYGIYPLEEEETNIIEVIA